MCTPDNDFAYSQLEGKTKPKKEISFIERIRNHNCVNKEVKDPAGYPELVNHPAAIAARKEQETCC